MTSVISIVNITITRFDSIYLHYAVFHRDE